MGLFKVKPIGEGKHNNIHFIATDKSKTIQFKIICFLETQEAYIISSRTKVDMELLNCQEIYNSLATEINKWDYVLKTPILSLFKNFQDTTGIIMHYNLFLN